MLGVACTMPLSSWRVGLLGYFLASLGLLSTAFSAARSSDGLGLAVLQHKQPLLQSCRHPDKLFSDVSILATKLVQSELGVFVMANFCMSLYAMTALLTTVVFLDRLSVRESTRLTERLIKYMVFKLIFVSAVVMPDLVEVGMWLAWFAVVGFMRIFVGAAKDRLEALMATPSASSAAHARTLALLLAMLATDALGSGMLWASAGSVQELLLFGFDAAVIACDGLKTLLRYGAHLLDQSLASSGPTTAAPAAHGLALWENWEGKGAFLYQTELLADVAIHLLTLAHYLHLAWLQMLRSYLVNLLLLLDMRSVVVQTFRRLRAHARYCAATHNLNHTFPDAATWQLQGADDCAICRDHMQAAKQLPCGHLFHLACLRAWLQQSGSDNFTCPMCRTPLFLTTPGKPAATATTATTANHQQAAGGTSATARWPLSFAALQRLLGVVAAPGIRSGAAAAAAGGELRQQWARLHDALVSEGLPPTEARDLTDLLTAAAAQDPSLLDFLPAPTSSHATATTATYSGSGFTSGDPLASYSDASGPPSSSDEDVLASMSSGGDTEGDEADIMRLDTRSRRRRSAAAAQQRQHSWHQRHTQHLHAHHHTQRHQLQQVAGATPSDAAAAVAVGGSPPPRRSRSALPAAAPELRTWSSEQLPRMVHSVAQGISRSVSSTLQRAHSDGPRHQRRQHWQQQQQQQEEDGDEEVDSGPRMDQGSRRQPRAVVGRGMEGGKGAAAAGAAARHDRRAAGAPPRAPQPREQLVLHPYRTRAAVQAQQQGL